MIYEAGPLAGGMMHFGIPEYRLPREVLDAEIARIAAMGVQIVLNHKVEDLMAEKAAGDFDAVFLAVGAHLSKRRTSRRATQARSTTRCSSSGTSSAARTRHASAAASRSTAAATPRWTPRARRSASAPRPLIIYRRTREQMPAHAFEADEAIEEGVKIHWLRTIKQIDGTTVTRRGHDAGRERLSRSRPESSRRSRPTRSILALGQDTDTAFLKNVPGMDFKKDGTVVVGPDMQTGCPGVFAGGDMVPFERTVTTAVGHGKKAARSIDAWLRATACGRRREARGRQLRRCCASGITREAKKRGQSTIDIERRRQTFDEVVGGLDRRRGAIRGAALPLVRQLLRVRRLLLGLPGAGRDQARARPALPVTTSTGAPAARSATTSARAARSR